MTVDEELAAIAESLKASYARIEARSGGKRSAYYEAWRSHMIQAIKLLHATGLSAGDCVERWEATQAAAGLPDRRTILEW